MGLLGIEPSSSPRQRDVLAVVRTPNFFKSESSLDYRPILNGKLILLYKSFL